MSTEKLKELIEKFRDETLDEKRFFEKFEWELRQGLHFSNLDEKNRKIIIDLAHGHKKLFRESRWPKDSDIREETYNLYKDRIKLGLTEDDLKDVKEILQMFKK